MILKIEKVQIGGFQRDLYCKGGMIIDDPSPTPPDRVVDGRGKLALPSFKNGHTHSAMTLLRGYADDMDLHDWLYNHIFPAEAQLDDDIIYWGTKLACLEMIKGGTTFCNDMYFNLPQSWKAFDESGLKVCNCIGITDFFDSENRRSAQEEIRETFQRFGLGGGRITLGLGLHAIYTNSGEMIEWVADFAGETGLPIHMHLAETEKEVKDCVAAHGKRPVEYLKERGILGSGSIFAHSLWLAEEELDLLAEGGATLVHCPVSNMKLACGGGFALEEFRKRGIPLMLGTDGPASNNNIDMLEEMKVAALLQKHHFQDPTVGAAEVILALASGGYASFFPGLGNSLEPGQPADIILLNPRVPEMVPRYDIAASLVYAASQQAVDTVICGGRILMEGRKVPGEEEILARAETLNEKFVKMRSAE